MWTIHSNLKKKKQTNKLKGNTEFEDISRHEPRNIFSRCRAYLEVGDQHFMTLLRNKVSWTAVEIWTTNTMHSQVSYAIQLPQQLPHWDQILKICSIASHTCSHSWTHNFVNVNISDSDSIYTLILFYYTSL